MSTLTDGIRDLVAGVAERVGPSVVGVSSRWAQGSGVVLAPGRILTNAHNIRAEEVTVTFADGRGTAGAPLGVDVDGDLAVLDADTGDAPAIGWADGSDPGIGDVVVALSNPAGRGLRATFGTVSGTERAFRGPRGRRIRGSIEHTAPLLPGSSGGPVVDGEGHLLGINTNRLGEGFYLALPADAALRERAEALGRGEAPGRRRIGIAVAPAGVARKLRRAVGLEEVDGVLVRGVAEDGPADRADLRQGDLITAVDGRPVASPDDLAEALGADRVELTILRGAEERTVTVEPEEG